jgi:hypothetical protein
MGSRAGGMLSMHNHHQLIGRKAVLWLVGWLVDRQLVFLLKTTQPENVGVHRCAAAFWTMTLTTCCQYGPLLSVN